MTRELLPEIWARVISHLRRPLPRPNGQNKREEIRQGDLAVAMRVCKLWNNLAAPHLYKVIVTDHLHSLAFNAHERAAAKGIKSKNQLMAYTTTLFIEYGDKMPSYTNLFRYGPDVFPLFSAPGMNEVATACGLEADDIKSGAAKLHSIPRPNMVHVATGAFLGGQLGIWQVLSLHSTPPALDVPKRIAYAAATVADLIYNSEGKKSYYCHRVEYGPLCYTPISPSTATLNIIRLVQHRAHFESHPGQLPPLFGGKARWYATFNDIRSPGQIGNAAYYLGAAVTNHAQIRESVYRGSRMSAEAIKMSVEIYLPPILTTPAAEKQLRAKLSEAVLEAGVPASKYADKWEMKKIQEAPSCEVCSWSVKDLTDKVQVMKPFSFEGR